MLLRWTKTELISAGNNPIDFDEDISFDPESFTSSRLRNLKDVHVSGVGYYDAHSDLFEVEMSLDGIMVLPCAISNQDVEVSFDFDAHEVFSFVDVEDVDIHLVKNGIIELLPVIFQLIYLEIPLKVVKEDFEEYPSGDGWRIIKEEDLKKEQKDSIDPRLAKLKDFKFNDE